MPPRAGVSGGRRRWIVGAVFEIKQGVSLVERRDGRQGALLRRWLDDAVRRTNAGRITAIDEAVAVAASHLHVPDPMSIPRLDDRCQRPGARPDARHAERACTRSIRYAPPEPLGDLVR